MAEQFENDYSTILNGAIDDNDTTLTVDAAPVNMTGTFRIKIDDELILVGEVSGLTFTGCTRGVEGTTAASHSDNAVVTHVLTAESLSESTLSSITNNVLLEEHQIVYRPATNILVLNRTGSGSLGGGYTEDTGNSFTVEEGKTYRVTLSGWGGGTLNMGMRFDPGNITDAWYTGPTHDFVAPASTTTGLLFGRANGANLIWTSYTVEEVNEVAAPEGFDTGEIGRDLLQAETLVDALLVLDPIITQFGTPDASHEFTTSSLAALTSLSTTPDTASAHSTVPNNLILADDDSHLVGYYASVTAPFTAICKINEIYLPNQYAYVGMFTGVATPGKMTFHTVCNNGNSTFQFLTYTGPTDGSPGTPGYTLTPIASFVATELPYYLAVVATSNTSVAYYWSRNGDSWYAMRTGHDNSMTIGSVGVGVAGYGAVSKGMFDYLRIWNSAKTMPVFA